jgi:hypothetical protein
MGDYIQNEETGRFEGSEPGGSSSSGGAGGGGEQSAEEVAVSNAIADAKAEILATAGPESQWNDVQKEIIPTVEGEKIASIEARAPFLANSVPLEGTQLQGVMNYQSGDISEGGMALNESLREGGAPEANVNTIDAAIAQQGPTTSDATLYRVVGTVPRAGSDVPVPSYTNLPVGTSFTDPGYASTTAGTGLTLTADNFGQHLVTEPGETGGQLLEIHAPAGTQALDMNSVLSAGNNNFAEQNEVVLPRGSEFQVLQQLEDRTVVQVLHR